VKVAALISVRNKSERFPGKILKPLHGQSVFEHLVDRIKLATEVDRVIIATSDDPRDQVFVDIAQRKDIGVFLGSRADKLKRYLDALDEVGFEAGIVIDGDDILCFPEIVDETARALRERRPDVVLWRGLPLGAASSGLTRRALSRIMELKNEEDTEVWGGYFTRGDFDTLFLESDEPLFRQPEVRMTLDYQEDYDFLVRIFDELYGSNPRFSSRELMDVLVHRHPEWNDITKPAQERYESNITRAAPVKFKTESTSA
jgi:spore coat polysaccharide biosynthesis protein SpsF (cytidylyltransferase family)